MITINIMMRGGTGISPLGQRHSMVDCSWNIGLESRDIDTTFCSEASNTATDLCSRFFGKLANSPAVRDRFRLVIKIFAASPVILDTALWEDILESFSHNTEELIVVTNEKNESLSRFLRLERWQDLKTDFLLSGQELLVKPV